jgi:hypothetical protein
MEKIMNQIKESKPRHHRKYHHEIKLFTDKDEMILYVNSLSMVENVEVFKIEERLYKVHVVRRNVEENQHECCHGENHKQKTDHECCQDQNQKHDSDHECCQDQNQKHDSDHECCHDESHHQHTDQKCCKDKK